MIVGSVFDGDDDAQVAWKQHHVYASALRIIVGTCNRLAWGTEQEGGVEAVAEILHDFWVASSRNELIGEIVEQASKAMEAAASILSRANLWKSQKNDDTHRMHTTGATSRGFVIR